VTICPATDWHTQVGSINVLIDGYIKDDYPDYPSTEYAGIMYRFGDDGRTIVTRNAIITGPIGLKIGWFMWLKKGTPNKFRVQTFNIPYVDGSGYTSLPFAVPFPKNLQGTYFTVTLNDRWAHDEGWADVPLTRATSLSGVWSDTMGKKFFYDSATGYLYLKLVSNFDPQGWGYAPENFKRGGATLFDQSGCTYYITLTQCPGCTVLTSDNGVTYYQPPTKIPPALSVLP
jgi:hypothetical protein